MLIIEYCFLFDFFFRLEKFSQELDTKYYVFVSNNGSVEKVYIDYKYGEMIYFFGDVNLTSNQQNNIQSNNDTIKKISDFVLNQPICSFCGSIELLKYKYGSQLHRLVKVNIF